MELIKSRACQQEARQNHRTKCQRMLTGTSLVKIFHQRSEDDHGPDGPCSSDARHLRKRKRRREESRFD